MFRKAIAFSLGKHKRESSRRGGRSAVPGQFVVEGIIDGVGNSGAGCSD